MAETSDRVIPDAVLNLLRHKWRIEPEYSAFDHVFEQRAHDPSYYKIGVGRTVETEFDTFSHAEAKALVVDEVFGPHARDFGERGVSINEHAQHALVDCLGEMYAAWQKYEKRLMRIPAHHP